MTATAIIPRPDRKEINRKNSLKSTGPRSREGKNRSKYNALKHGLTASTVVLPGEDPERLQSRLDAWTADLQPQNAVEQDLIEQAVHSFWKLDRAERAERARIARSIESAPVDDANRQRDEVAALGLWLLSDRDVMGHLRLRGNVLDVLVPDQKCTYPDCRVLGILDHPEAIVRRLETTAAGCQWLIDRWTKLRAPLENGAAWGWDERLEAIRLLGKRPMDMEPAQWEAFLEFQNGSLPPMPEKTVEARLNAQLDERLTAKKPETLAIHREVVDRALARLEPIAAEQQRRAEVQAARRTDILAFDAGADAELLRRYQFACTRTVFRSLDMFLKVRKSGVAEPEDQSSTAENTSATEVNTQRSDENGVTPKVVESANASPEPCPAFPVACPVQPAVDREHSPIEPMAAPVPDGKPPIESTTPEVADIARTRLPLLRTVLSALALLILSGAAIRSPGYRQDEPVIVPNDPAQIREGEPPGHGARTQPRPSGITKGRSGDRRNQRNEARCQNGSASVAEKPVQSGDPGRVRGIERPCVEHFWCWPREPSG